MSLTKAQIEEIAAFDWARRTGREYDGRRFGSATGEHVPYLTSAWIPCRPKMDGRISRKTLRYNYIEIERAPGRSLADVVTNGAPAPKPLAERDVTVVHVAVRLDGSYRQVVKDVARFHPKTGRFECRDIDYRGIAGWIVYWQRNDYVNRRHAADAGNEQLEPRMAEPVDSGWWDGGKWKFKTGLAFPWHETINPEALADSRYKWCQFTPSARIGLVDWLMLYRAEPKVELLAKAGLHCLINPAGILALKDRRVFDWVRAHMDKLKGERTSVRDVLYAARHGVSVRTAYKRFLFVSNMKYALDGVRRELAYRAPEDGRDKGGERGRWRLRVDYDRLQRLLLKWGVDVFEYGRYLEYAVKCGLDVRNEGTLYPPVADGRKSFVARLERLEREDARLRRAEARRRAAELKAEREAEEKRVAALMAERAGELAAFQRAADRARTLRGTGYTIILAKSQKELLAEGRKMNNCVGMGTYGEAIVAGRSLIVMLKTGSKSTFDIEIDRRTWKVRQCYARSNKSAPKDVHALASAIAQVLKAEYKRLAAKKRRKAA